MKLSIFVLSMFASVSVLAQGAPAVPAVAEIAPKPVAERVTRELPNGKAGPIYTRTAICEVSNGDKIGLSLLVSDDERTVVLYGGMETLDGDISLPVARKTGDAYPPEMDTEGCMLSLAGQSYQNKCLDLPNKFSFLQRGEKVTLRVNTNLPLTRVNGTVEISDGARTKVRKAKCEIGQY